MKRLKRWSLVVVMVVFLSGCLPHDSGDVKIQLEGDKGKPSTTEVVVIESPSEADVQEKTLETDDQQASNPASNPGAKPQAEILEDWTWERDGDWTTIMGSVKNTGTVPIGFFRIKAEFTGHDGQVLDTETAVYGEAVWPEHEKRFKISKAYKPEYRSVRLWIEKLDKAREPVIRIEAGHEAEILKGWTWTAKGQYSYIEGVVENTGESDIHYYKIMAEFAGAEGEVLDSTFTNANKVIKPGDRDEFRIMHPYAPEYQEVTIYISALK